MTLDQMLTFVESIERAPRRLNPTFSAIENKLSQRRDLHAMLLLDSLLPSETDIIGSSRHDEFWFSVEPAELAAVITKDQIVELLACGVMISGDGLSMFA